MALIFSSTRHLQNPNTLPSSFDTLVACCHTFVGLEELAERSGPRRAGSSVGEVVLVFRESHRCCCRGYRDSILLSPQPHICAR
jgi:hypothetical protein